MATYRNQAERDADLGFQQQQTQQGQVSVGATDTPPPGTPPPATPAAPTTPMGVDPAAPAAPPPPPMTAPPWLQPQTGDGQMPPTGDGPVNPQGPNPGVQVAQEAPWEGANPITLTRTNNTGLPDLQTGLDTSDFAGLNLDFQGASQDAADQAYAGATQYFDEDFGRANDAARTQLINQGLQPGTEAYDKQLSLMQRGQDQARTGAAFQAQQIGHQQAGDLLMRALSTRQQQASEQGQNATMGLTSRGMLSGERNTDADRLYNQSMGVAGLGLGARGQSLGRDTALQGNATAAAANANNANNQRYGIDTQAQLGLRGLGLQQDSMDFQQLMALINGARGGVNMPNFGSPAPLDVGGAHQIAVGAQNAQDNRDAQDRSGLYGLGGAALNGFFRSNGY